VVEDETSLPDKQTSKVSKATKLLRQNHLEVQRRRLGEMGKLGMTVETYLSQNIFGNTFGRYLPGAAVLLAGESQHYGKNMQFHDCWQGSLGLAGRQNVVTGDVLQQQVWHDEFKEVEQSSQLHRIKEGTCDVRPDRISWPSSIPFNAPYSRLIDQETRARRNEEQEKQQVQTSTDKTDCKTNTGNETLSTSEDEMTSEVQAGASALLLLSERLARKVEEHGEC